jgi:hypothetical protein
MNLCTNQIDEKAILNLVLSRVWTELTQDRVNMLTSLLQKQEISVPLEILRKTLVLTGI